MKQQFIVSVFLASLCADLTFAQECKTSQCSELAATQRESALLANHPGRIQRDGDNLIIRTSAKKPLVFKNDHSESYSEHAVYLVQGIVPRHGWVIVGVNYYEGGGHLLVSMNSGEQLEFGGYEDPALSPDGNRLLLFSQDLEAGYDPNFIAIYRFENGKAIQEVMLEGGDLNSPGSDLWGASQARWLDNTTVVYSENRFGPGGPYSGSLQTTPVQLKLVNGKWKKAGAGKPADGKNK